LEKRGRGFKALKKWSEKGNIQRDAAGIGETYVRVLWNPAKGALGS